MSRGAIGVPVLFAPDVQAAKRTVEFFTANIRNPHTRKAYARAAAEFAAWCDAHGIHRLGQVQPVHVAAYVEALQRRRAVPSVKQQLAALRMLFDWLVVGQVIPNNPAASVQGPKHAVKKGKTPVLAADEYLQAYVTGAQLVADPKGWLFRTAIGRTGQLSERSMTQADVYRIIRRRAEDAGIHTRIGCHTFRATGITEYLRNGGKLEIAQQMANHESALTTGLYGRRNDQVSLDEVERILI